MPKQPSIVKRAQDSARERVYSNVDMYTTRRAIAIEGGADPRQGTSGSFMKHLIGYKKGGKVKRTGPAYLHKGERVLTKKQTQKYEKQRKKVFGLK